jgi:hypothetical protein
MHVYLSWIPICMYVCIDTHMRTCHGYLYACIHAYVHTYLTCMLHACIHVYMHTCLTCIHVYIHTYILDMNVAYMHIYIYIYIYIYTCIHIFIHTYIMLHACILVYIHTYIHTWHAWCIPTSRAYPHAYSVPSCIHGHCMHPYIPICTHTCLTRMHEICAQDTHTYRVAQIHLYTMHTQTNILVHTSAVEDRRNGIGSSNPGDKGYATAEHAPEYAAKMAEENRSALCVCCRIL